MSPFTLIAGVSMARMWLWIAVRLFCAPTLAYWGDGSLSVSPRAAQSLFSLAAPPPWRRHRGSQCVREASPLLASGGRAQLDGMHWAWAAHGFFASQRDVARFVRSFVFADRGEWLAGARQDFEPVCFRRPCGIPLRQLTTVEHMFGLRACFELCFDVATEAVPTVHNSMSVVSRVAPNIQLVAGFPVSLRHVCVADVGASARAAVHRSEITAGGTMVKRITCEPYMRNDGGNVCALSPI